MRFEENERKPGEKTNLILEATPGSRVAFVAVDKSVHLLRAGNELTKDKIQPHRRTYRERAYNRNRKCNDWHPWWRGKRSSPPFWGWGDRSEYVDASEAFNVSLAKFMLKPPRRFRIHKRLVQTPLQYVRKHFFFGTRTTLMHKNFKLKCFFNTKTRP